MLTKDRVFQIMGKYYGNAYFRSAITNNIPEDDLLLTAKILDQINSLGYHFSNLHALQGTVDWRFVPIILEYYPCFISDNYNSELISLVCHPVYQDFVPELLSIYEKSNSSQVRLDISQALLCIRSKKYIPEYLRLVNKEDFGYSRDYLIDLLCKLRVEEVVPKLLELLNKNPIDWRWTFLRYAPVFKDASLVPLIEPYLESDDSELKMLARKAIRKLTYL